MRLLRSILLAALSILAVQAFDASAAATAASADSSAAAAAAAASAAAVSAGVRIQSLSALHHTLHRVDHHASARVSNRAFESASAATTITSSPHSIQLQGGVLRISEQMMTTAAFSRSLQRVNTTAEELSRAWRNLWRRSVLRNAENQRMHPDSGPEMPCAPHRVFTAEFFTGESQRLRAHEPHVIRNVALERKPALRGTDGDDAAPPALVSLHVPSAHTLDAMRSYFTAHGSEWASEVAARYGLSHLMDDALSAAVATSSALLSHERFHFQWLVHLKSPITTLVVAQLEALIQPYTLKHYLPHSSFLVALPYELALKLRQDSAGLVLFVCMIDPSMKLQPELEGQLLHSAQQRHNEGGATRSLDKRMHELRLSFALPTFSSAAVASAAADLAAAVRSRFPAHSSDLRLTQSFAARAAKFWNNHPRFLSAMTQAAGEVGAALQLQGIEFKPIDSHQMLIRLPALFDPASLRDAGSFLSFFLATLAAHPMVQHVESRAQMRSLNKHARLVVQADHEVARSVCTGAPANHELLSAAAVGTRSRSSAYAVAPTSSDPSSDLPFSSLLRLDGGAGSVLTIADEGVDHDSCFFHDARHAVTMNSRIPDPLHRKIAGYHTASISNNDPTRGPGGDGLEGHGTHTAGSLAGSISAAHSFPPGYDVDNYTTSALSAYNGLSPASRLLVFDFENPGDPDLLVPDAIDSEYLDISRRDFGSHIGSNSWGNEAAGYDSYTLMIDRWLAAHEDYLFVIAAGNDGLRGSTTIASPAVAKNVLTVGASMNGVCSFWDQGLALGINVIEPAVVAGSYTVAPASFGLPLHDARPSPRAGETNLRACYASPPDACTVLLNAADCSGKVVFTERSRSCVFTDKAAHVQAAGGVAMILLNNDVTAPSFTMDAGTGHEAAGRAIHIALAAVDQPVAQRLRPVLQSADPAIGVASLRLALPTFNPIALQSEHTLSDFSSKGPTQDGRLKPDVLAPGESIESASSDGNLGSFQCVSAMQSPRMGSPESAPRTWRKEAAIASKAGTSMACPVAAGTASLVRQYFVEGRYEEPISASAAAAAGSSNTDPRVPLLPSSALLKAVLVSGTSAVSGSTVVTRGGGALAHVDVEPPPSYHQGFGRVELAESLSYDEEGDDGARHRSKYRLFVRDGVLIQTGQMHAYCFRIRDATTGAAPATTPPAAFKATLVWTDPASAAITTMLQVNNLDLSVVAYDIEGVDSSGSPSGHRVFIGNARLQSAPLNYDTSNNVEKAVEPHPVPGKLYAVYVRGTHVPVSLRNGTLGQPYALVVNGDMDALGSEECPREVYCVGDCSGHGQCIVSVTATASTPGANTGVCQCEAQWAGSDCSVPTIALIPVATALSPPGQASVTSARTRIQPDRWTYFSYTVGSLDRSADFSFRRSNTQGDPDFYLSVPGRPDLSGLTYPTLQSYAYANTECDSCPNQPATHHQSLGIVDLFAPSDQTAKLGGATVVLGVWGYCCDESEVEVTLTVQKQI